MFFEEAGVRLDRYEYLSSLAAQPEPVIITLALRDSGIPITGELIARILLFPILSIIAIGPIVGSGIGAYFIVSSDHLTLLSILTWAIFAVWILVVLNISPPGLSFDINTIIRFPLSFPRYLTARIFFGLLSASTVITDFAVPATSGIPLPIRVWAIISFGLTSSACLATASMSISWSSRRTV